MYHSYLTNVELIGWGSEKANNLPQNTAGGRIRTWTQVVCFLIYISYLMIGQTDSEVMEGKNQFNSMLTM